VDDGGDNDNDGDNNSYSSHDDDYSDRAVSRKKNLWVYQTFTLSVRNKERNALCGERIRPSACLSVTCC
jgi:hypothetical protein